MGFTVTAWKSGREFSHRQPSLLHAVDLSLSLRLSGMSDIRVIDDSGRTYDGADMSRLLSQARGGERRPPRDGLDIVSNRRFHEAEARRG